MVDIEAICTAVGNEKKVPRGIKDSLVRVALDLAPVCSWSGIVQYIMEDVRSIFDGTIFATRMDRYGGPVTE